MKAFSLITIGYAKQAFDRESREHARMQGYASHLASMHVIVFTHRREKHVAPVASENLTVYPTNSWARPLMLIDALLIGFRILRRQTRTVPVLISSQDPFETSLVGRTLAFLTGTPHHVQLHGDNFSDTTWRRESLLNHVRYRYGLHVLRSAHAIRVVSERIKTSLIGHGVKGERITVLPIRPELERFIAHPHTVGEHNPFVFLASSRFSREKNIPLMIRAFKKLGPLDARLRIVGRGPEEVRIRSLIDELNLMGRVEIVSWSETIECEMRDADVFLLASNHEAYGLTLIEAMAAGLPIITTNVGCVGEVLKDGTHALVVPVGDEDAFVHAMDRMLGDTPLRTRMSSTNREVGRTLARRTQEAYAEEWVATLARARGAVY